jgi:hypothetical protein
MVSMDANVKFPNLLVFELNTNFLNVHGSWRSTNTALYAGISFKKRAATIGGKNSLRLGSNFGPITSKQGLKPAINNHVSCMTGKDWLYVSLNACLGLNRRRLRSSVVRKTAFLLPPVRISVKQILMGAPIGCPKPPLSTEAKPSRNRHLSWGTHKSRTRGSLA